MAGGLLYSVRTWSSPLGSRYVSLLLAAALSAAPLIAARSVPAGAVCSFLAGLATAPTFSCQYALVSQVVGSGTTNEAFSWISSALVAGIAAGSAVGGAVVGPLGVEGPFLFACTLSVVGGLLALRFRGRFGVQPELA
jgi:predicted MFS family arabinose efflux permease